MTDTSVLGLAELGNLNLGAVEPLGPSSNQGTGESAPKQKLGVSKPKGG